MLMRCIVSLFPGLTAVGNDLKINPKNVPWTVLGDDLTAYDCYLGIKADRSLYGKARVSCSR